MEYYQRSKRARLLALVIALAAPTAALAAPTVWVSPDGICAGNSPCFNTLQAGVNNAGDAASTVFVFPGTYAESVDLSLMGSAGPAQDDLTIQAVDASGTPAIVGVTVSPAAGEAFWNSIDPFPFALTFNGLTIGSATTDAMDLEGVTGVVTLNDMIATGAVFDGFDVRSSNSVFINRTRSTANGSDGFEILLEAAGDVIITSSVGDDNGGGTASGSDGFEISIFNGRFSAIDVSASRNGSDGMQISTTDAAGIDGIITSATFLRVTANDNGPRVFTGDSNAEDGVEVKPDEIGGQLGDVSIIDSTAMRNLGSGFEIDAITDGDYLVTGSEASDNGHDGFQLDVTANQNTDFGSVGQTTIRNVIANRNGTLDESTGDGIALEYDSDCDENQFVNMLFENITTNDNEDDGIEATAVGSIIARNIEANGNGFGNSGTSERDGIELGRNADSSFNCSPASIEVSHIVTNDNAGDGLQLQASGPITASNVVALRNGNPAADRGSTGKDGLDFENSEGPGGAIVVNGCTASANSGDGLKVIASSTSAVMINDCDADGNGEDGIDTLFVDVDRGSDEVPLSVQLARITATGNGDDGIDAGALGAVSMADVCAIGNTSDGILSQQHGSPLTIGGAVTSGNRYGLAFKNLLAQPATVTNADISGNTEGGAINEQAGALISALGNYWGAASGPTHPNNAPGTGDDVFDGANQTTGTIDFSGFVGAPLGQANCPQRFFSEVDVAVTKTDNVAFAIPGESVIYTIVASNDGPGDALGVLLEDPFPVELTCTWTSVASGGASGNTDGAGNLADLLDLPAGSDVTYTITCAIDEQATGTLANTAMATTLVTDTDDTNNQASDADTVLGTTLDIPTTSGFGVLALILLLAAIAWRTIRLG